MFVRVQVGVEKNAVHILEFAATVGFVTVHEVLLEMQSRLHISRLHSLHLFDEHGERMPVGKHVQNARVYTLRRLAC